ncbi:Heat shock protein cognate 20 [Carabus blaptoides fortunei]
MQSLLHPDKYSNKSDEEKQISEEYSSIVNKAYNILQSPINRGLHLLSLKGETINESDKNDDKEFLLEIMELNEEVEEANTPEELLNLNKKNRQVLVEITQELSKAFKTDNIFEAKKVLIRMKYYTSIATQINSILREKGIVE